jgi:hypothetical protein
LERAESQCLISKSLKATIYLAIDIDIDDVVIQPGLVAGARS